MEDGQANVMEDLCIACGYCVRVCAQHAKHIKDVYKRQIGRPLVVGAFRAGREGVKRILNKIQTELETAMLLTGCASLQDIGPRTIRIS